MTAKGAIKGVKKVVSAPHDVPNPFRQAVDGLLRRHRQKNAHRIGIQPFIAIKSDNKYVYTRDPTIKVARYR